MDLSAFLIPLRRWWWLIAVSTLVATVSSFIVTLNQPPIYQAMTTLMIGRVIEDPNPDQGEFFLAQTLAQTYADIANREPLRNATMDALDLSWLPEYDAHTVPQTQLIEIVVNDVNPLRAQVVANELANQLIIRSPTGSRPELEERQQFINTQLSNIQSQIIDTEDELLKLQEQLGTITSASELQETQSQISALQTKLTTLRGNYAALLANTQQGAVNTLSVIELAELPIKPIGPNKSLSIMISALVGFMLGAGAAYLLEYLDDTIRDPDEITKTFGVPVIGMIRETKLTDDGAHARYVSKHPLSPIAEAYRNLRTNLDFAGVDTPLRSLLVTSANTGSGKSSVVLNLAVVMTQGEKRIIVVDADLRKPTIHRFTGLSNNEGLSDLFRQDIDKSGVLKVWDDEKIGVITSGGVPPNPAELLGSKRMVKLLAGLCEMADMVILDGPPFIVSDALTLASKVDGVLIVIRPGHTRRKYVKSMMDQLDHVGARVVGVVFNRVPQRGAELYGGSMYYSSYFSDDGDESSPLAGDEDDGKPTQQRTSRGGVSDRLFANIVAIRSKLINRKPKKKKLGTESHSSPAVWDLGEEMEDIPSPDP